MKTSHSRLGPIWIITTTLLLLAPEIALARAGGGGGHGKGSWLNLVMLPIFLIYSAIVTYQVRKKSQTCTALLARIEKQDPAWHLDSIKHRVEQVFFKVQQAWMARDQNLAKDCMSDAIFEKHKLQTDQMIAQHRKNVLENIDLTETDIVDVEDFRDNKKDRFWVYLKGSMIDYTVNDTNDLLVAGSRSSEKFSELWKFIRSGDSWILDEIDQKVSLFKLKGFGATTESPAV
jgi:hypothetical protein